jgi:hypothetical protein
MMTNKVLINKVVGKIQHHYYKIQNFFLKKKAQIVFNPDWFSGKRVAVVGGADSAYQEKKGEYIDSFDVVVRINKGVESIADYSDFVGKKTDILFHIFFEGTNKTSSPITPKLWKKSNIKALIRTTSKGASQSYINKFLSIAKGINYVELPENIIKSATKSINGYQPTTGFIALYTILKAEPKELYITGITFLKTPHSNAYRTISHRESLSFLKKNNIHNTDIEFDWFFKKYHEFKEQNIIKTDKKLCELLGL